MNVLFPLAWWGLVALPLLLALYMLRRRHRPLPVAALFLWRGSQLKSGGGWRFSRLEQALLLLLELLMAALLVLAATGPGCRWRRRVHRVAVVLDDSASMVARAVSDGRTPAERAGEWLRQELHRRRPFECAMVLSGPSPRLASSSVTHDRDVAGVLRAWNPRQPAHGPGAALRLARQAVGEDGQVVWLTDHAPSEEVLAEGVQVLAFGEPLGNLGIVAAVRERDLMAGKETVVVEVVAFGPLGGGRTLTCRHGDRVLAQRELGVAGDGGRREWREVLSWDELLPGVVELELSGRDALAEDDRVLLLPEGGGPVRVQASFAEEATDLAQVFARTFAAMGGAVVAVESRPHLVVADENAARELVVEAEAAPAWWLVVTGSGDAVKRHFGPYVLARRHPLCRHLELTGVRWAAASAGLGESLAGSVPLISSAGVPLLAELPGDGDRREFRMSFLPGASNLQQTPAWPVLLHNLVLARAAAFPGFRVRNLRAGQEAIYRGPLADHAAEREVMVRELVSGQSREVRSGRFRGRRWGFASPVAGLFEVVFADGEDEPELLAWQFSCPEESDLRAAAAGEWGRPDGLSRLAAGGVWRDDAWLFLLAAWALCLLHLHVGARPRRGGEGAR